MTIEQLLLITISGDDKPGITAEFMSIIAKSHLNIVDMGQSVTRGLLSLSIVVETLPTSSIDSSQDFLKELVFKAKMMNLEVNFKPLTHESHEPVIRERFALSCISPHKIPSEFIATLAAYWAKNNLNILNISGEKATDNLHCIEFIVTSPSKSFSWEVAKKEILEISKNFRVDFSLVPDNIFRFNKRLIVFDMDSTLTKGEVIDELAKLHGVEKEVEKITHAAMEGKIDFNTALTKRVALLAGMPIEKCQEVLQKMEFTPGTQRCISVLKSLGYYTAVISGGFDIFANSVRDKLKLDFASSNVLEQANGKLTGKISGDIVNGETKARLMKEIADRLNISLEQVIAVGDGANDIPMLSKAGMGIAFHAKENVKKNISQHLSFSSMDCILTFLGVPTYYIAQFK